MTSWYLCFSKLDLMDSSKVFKDFHYVTGLCTCTSNYCSWALILLYFIVDSMIADGLVKGRSRASATIPDSKVHVANMGPTWVLSAPDGPHVGPMNLAIGMILPQISYNIPASAEEEFTCCYLYELLDISSHIVCSFPWEGSICIVVKNI